ncbi:MAG: hypothetical protein ACI9HK_001647 [Pirellulaceae bacterium]|jgi:hypothetical protein
MNAKHPFVRRLMWNPFFVAIPFLYVSVTTYTFLTGFIPTTSGGFAA